jgi:hypothetical protein
MQLQVPQLVHHHEQFVHGLVVKLCIVEETAFCWGHLSPPAIEKRLVGGMQLDGVRCQQVLGNALQESVRRGANDRPAFPSPLSCVL